MIFAVMIFWAQMAGAAGSDEQARWSEKNEAYRKARAEYAESASKFNAHVLRSGSTMDEEAKALRADVEAMRVQSEAMRRELGAIGLPQPATGQAPAVISAAQDKAYARRQGKALWKRILPWLPSLAAVIFLVVWAVNRLILDKRRPKVHVRCPGCGRILRVAKRSKRFTFKCPECGKKAAYNPEKSV